MPEIKFSLIIATLNRENELILFLKSLLSQTIFLSDFEVIIVDQNESDLINNIVIQFSNQLNIRHIRSNQKGLSLNRNIGIKIAKGKYLCVPDDDCTYYPETLYAVWNALVQNDFPEMVIGSVFDKERNKYVFKKTPSIPLIVTKNNFYPLVSSITLFFKNSGVLFDENFGIGARYHSNEDGDLILYILDLGKKICYSPNIICNHPPYNSDNTDKNKLFKYGIGFGAMCRKHISINTFWLFLKVICFQFLMTSKHFLTFDQKNMDRRWSSLKGRWIGFFNYEIGE